MSSRPRRWRWRWFQTLVLFAVLQLYGCLAQVQEASVDFTRRRYNATLPENPTFKMFATPSERMGITLADPTLQVRYRIVDGDTDELFKADSKNVGDFWFLLLRTKTGYQAVPNREYRDTYVLKVRATITSTQKPKLKMRAKTEVVIRLLDTNDNNPLFYPKEYNVTVPEDTPVFSSIVSVSAVDPDLGVNGEIYYSFLQPTLQFSVHPTRGVVMLTRPLEFQEQRFHTVMVVAEDRGPKFRTGRSDISQTAMATLTVVVVPVNLHAPEIFVRSFRTILPQTNTPQVYAIVKVVDKDRDQHGEIDSLTIVSGDSDGLFRISVGSQPNQYSLELEKRTNPSLVSQSYSLTLKATDKGTPPKSTTQIIDVKLEDVYEYTTRFEKDSYDLEVSEVVPVNTPLVRLRAGASENIIFNIESGNRGSAFSLNHRTGQLSTAKPLDYESTVHYVLSVSATDRGVRTGNKKSLTTVNIQILDANDNDPIFNQSRAVVTFDENRPVGSVVFRAHAVDRDSKENGYISYSLANINQVPFSVNHFTGDVTTTEVLDYETMRRDYAIRIRASDWGAPFRRQAEMLLRVQLRDINDHRPQFEKINCVATVAKKAPVGTEVMTLSAIDFDAGSVVRYLLVSDEPCFKLDADTGVLKLTCDLTKQLLRDKGVNVSATDGQHYADVMFIPVNVLTGTRNSKLSSRMATADCHDVGVTERLKEQFRLGELNNQGLTTEDVTEPTPSRFTENRYAPEFLPTLPSEISINESLPFGSVVINMEARDPDHGYNSRVVYVISNGDEDSCFSMDLYSGTVQVMGELDRETNTKYVLNISAYDLGAPQKSASRTLVVHVLDVNDNVPTFEKSSYSFVIPENAVNGTSIVRLRATDLDDGLNAVLTFDLLTDTQDFHIDETSGLLTVRGPLDRETVEEYNLRVRVSDSDPQRPLTSTTLIQVRLVDINDNPPIFGRDSYLVKVREDIPVGAVVMTLSAHDPDLEEGGEVRYSIADGDEGQFEIDPLMGVVRLIGRLDFEERQIYNVTLEARDRGQPSLTSVTSLLVEVGDVNENLYPPRFENFVEQADVRENQPVGTVVVHVTALDADLAEMDREVVYSIRDGSGLGVFSIDAQGYIRTRAVLDRETQSSYWLTVYAQDRGAVSLSTRLEVYVEVLDENDNVPLTSDPVYYPSVSELSPPNTSVVRLDAFDLDANPDSRLFYELTSGDPRGHFSVDKISGLISTTEVELDREEQSEYILEITISDSGEPTQTSVSRVVVSVSDINDNAPEFRQAIFKCSVPEMPRQDQEVLLCQVLAMDADVGENGEIEYDIMEGAANGRFRIHSKTGAIYSQKSFELGQVYELMVRAEDSGIKSLFSTARVIIEVVSSPKASTSAPVIRAVESHVRVTENDKIGHLVTLIQAEDPDRNKLWYTISDGNTGDVFMMQPDQGAILLAKQLDYDLQKFYNLTIKISDGIHSVYSNLQVEVTDTNNHQPIFTQRTYTVEISENIPVATDILHLTATDRDQDKRLLYEIHNSATPLSMKKFHLDPLSGVLTIAEPLDRELCEKHILTLIVKDHGTPAKRDYARVVVHVQDHNDHAPEFLSPMFQGQVYETSAVGSSVVQLLAVDRDHGRNAQITYSIVSGNIGGAFGIDPLLGTILVADELNSYTMAEYFLVVRATDSGIPSLNSTVSVRILVTVADNAPPKFEKREYSAELEENQKVGILVVSVTAVSRSSSYYEIVGGNRDGCFSIDPISGAVRTQKVLDYEEGKFYNLTVRATNLVNANTTCSVGIHVLDQNDNSPTFQSTTYQGWISEIAEIGSYVMDNTSNPLVVAATDLDSGLNSLFQFEIVEKFAQKLFQIDQHTGAISIGEPVDRERENFYQFSVQVTDSGKPRLHSAVAAIVNVTIVDVNDSPPIFEKPSYAATLLLPTYRGVSVARVRAEDPDENPVVKYRIVSGNNDDKFSIDDDTGLVLVIATEGLRSEYELVIVADDGAYESSCKLQVKVQETHSSGLKFSKSKYEAKVWENLTEVQTVAIVTVLGSSLSEDIVFSILNPVDLFTIGRTSGVIQSTGQPFDREIRSSYTLVVEAKSDLLETPRVAHVLVEITILDVNDNAPMFVNLPYHCVVPIEAQPNYLVQKVQAIDLDMGIHGYVQYQMVNGDEGIFQVDKKNGEIHLRKALGSQNTEYRLVIAAVDGGEPPKRSEVVVPIKVINRNMPVFPRQFYSQSVAENVGPKVPILTLQADSPQGRQLIYSIVEGNSQEEFGVDFNTDPETSTGPCVLFAIEELDYEVVRNHQLTLRATDSVSGAYTQVTVSISVEDVNDNPPMFVQASYNSTVSEMAPFGTSIARVHATDKDTGNNQKIQYHIVGNASSAFHIDPWEGIVFIKQSLDHESTSLHHFLVMATDGGSPALSSTAHMWVTVVDTNDNPPRFSRPAYHAVVSEHAHRGQFITMVVATDPDSCDEGKLLYSIIGGNVMQAFSIDHKTGTISLANIHHLTEISEHHLNVSVSDGVHSAHAGVRIRVFSANKQNPIFTKTVYEVALPENYQPGTSIITVTATDDDKGDYGRITYSLQSEESKKTFIIHPMTGDIQTQQPLDREKRHLYEVPVVAYDGGGRCGFALVRLSVTDANDNAPVFSLAEYKSSIHSNTTVGTTILKVHAVDADSDEAGSVEYSIYETNSSAPPSLFAITHDSGEVYLHHSVVSLENSAYQFFIRARDRGNPRLESEVPVVILVVEPKEDIPQFEQHSYEYFLSERSPIGTVVTTLNATAFRPVRYTLAPAVQGSNAELSLSKFSIDAQGRLLLMAQLDREKQSKHIVNVIANLGSSVVSSVDIIINVMDDNDNSPLFESSVYHSKIAENVQKGSTVLRIMASDPDVGRSAEISYSFGEDPQSSESVFHLDSKTGWVTTLLPLDREAVAWYNFSVVAMDNGTPPLSSTSSVRIEILDYNDNPPTFKRQRYDVSINEDESINTVILTLETVDADEEPELMTEYYLTTGNPHGQFQIYKKGEVSLKKSLDREKISAYVLQVVATDGTFVTGTQIFVDIVDANDNPPVCLKGKYTELVSESIASQTYILTVEATDNDEGRNAGLGFLLSGKGSQDFFIESSSGLLKTKQTLDRERQSHYLLTAQVHDKGKPEWYCTSLVEILLSDINDNAPVFTQEVYTVSVPEDSQVGTLVSKIHATDADLGKNRKITYSFVDSAHGHFSVDEKTGIIRLKKPLDREEKAIYNLTIQARDYGTPQLSSLGTLLVAVQDINDNPPEFTQKFYVATLPENRPIGTDVAKVIATSKDTGVNADITYAIIEGNEQAIFRIHPKSGVISVAKALDFEEMHAYYLTILARDGGTPSLSNQASVNVTITDINDNSPVFNQQTYYAVVREDAQQGDKVIQVMASDGDSAPYSKLAYKIVSGDRQEQFYLDDALGYISVASALDRETISNYVLQVICEDSGSPSLSSTTYVNIEVSDINDNAPQFADYNQTTIVQEGKPLGLMILKFTVLDADSPPNAGPFRFEILSGNEDQAFRLVQQDGTLRTAMKFDHKSRTDYLLHVRVYDMGTPILFSDTWVSVLVIEESRYPPMVAKLEVVVSSYLDEFPGGVMGRIHATDQDPYDKLTYGIVSHQKQLFTIDPEDGMLQAKSGLDVGLYQLNISVSDGKFSSYSTASIQVQLITEEAVSNSVGIRLDDVTPEDFLLTCRVGFLKGLRDLLGVRIKDVDIISIQPTREDSKRQRRSQQDLDVLFAVHKGVGAFYSPKLIQFKLLQGKNLMESAMNLKIVEIMQDRCTRGHCVHGECVDRVVMDEKYPLSITTELFSFVSPQHQRKVGCVCQPGYGGGQCELVINECARKPCPSHQVCSPDSSPLGYVCRCPNGWTGVLCDKNVTCVDSTCYVGSTPITFSGKSYSRYTLANNIERHLDVSFHLRTKQRTGNLMFTAGQRDYSIVEIMDGLVQYRFDCGSGEGLVRVEPRKVNDGAWHEVKVERRGNTAKVIVDSRFKAVGGAPGVHEVLNLDGQDVYFGAEVRTNTNGHGSEEIQMGFMGCLDDIRIDSTPLPLHVSGRNVVATLRRFANVEFHCNTLYDPGACGSQPCQNGGTCTPLDSSYSCQCLPRFLGSHCETDTDPCASSPCLNSGSCRNLKNDFHCDCLPNLSGKRCDYGRYCNPNPCMNSAVCEEGSYGPICKCRGFQGDRCQHDTDECQQNLCANGATCINLIGTFRCHCPANVTGPTCSEHFYTTSITSSTWNTTLEEVIGIAMVIVFILIMAIILACCWRYRHKRRRQRPNNEIRDDPAASQYLMKNSVHGKDNLKRQSKLSNLEVTSFTTATPLVPPRPASYTPTTQENMCALSKFDTLHSYGSAADDLESVPRYGNEFVQNLSKPFPTSESGSKAGWEQESSASKDNMYQEKIQNDLKPNKAPLTIVNSLTTPSSQGVSSVLSLTSDDDAAGYHWDCSDWATNQKPCQNITEVSMNELRDSSSMQSGETNSQNSQIDLLPGKFYPPRNILRPEPPDSEYVGDSENDFDDNSSHPDFEQLLMTKEIDFVDDGVDSLPSSPLKYQCHPNHYLPPHKLTADAMPNICELSDGEEMTFDFPSQGGKGCFSTGSDQNGDYTRTSGLDSMSMGGYTSTNASCSDISANVCEIEDSEANLSDTELEVARRKPRIVSYQPANCTHVV